MKNILLLVLGLVLTLLFILFPSAVYETGYFQNEFSNEMYNENLYFMSAVLTAGITWTCSAVYYYLVNSVSFSRWYHWIIVMTLASVASTIAGYMYCSNFFSAMGFDFAFQLRNFSFVNFVIGALLFTVSSFSIRWWSTNCRHTPFPE